MQEKLDFCLRHSSKKHLHFPLQMFPVLHICTRMSSKTLCKTIISKKIILNINYVVLPGVYPSDINSLYRSTEIEQTDDIHAELVEDEDEEVMFPTYKIHLLYFFSSKLV